MIIIQPFSNRQFITDYHKWQYIILTKDYVLSVLPDLAPEKDKYSTQLKYAFTAVDPDFLNKYAVISDDKFIDLIKQLPNNEEDIMT